LTALFQPFPWDIKAMAAMNSIFRVHLTCWTASFRYPNLISGTQPTLPVPPLSTLNGLLSAAMGTPYTVDSQKERFGFFFTYKGRGQDLETIYQMGQKLTGIKQNVLKREFLTDGSLYIYTSEEEIARAFSSPKFQMLLGRSTDLASVGEIISLPCPEEKIQLENLKGTIVPFTNPGTGACHFLAAPVQALPRSFDQSYPRRNIGTAPFYILDKTHNQTTPIQAKGIHDEELGIDIFWQ